MISFVIELLELCKGDEIKKDDRDRERKKERMNESDWLDSGDETALNSFGPVDLLFSMCGCKLRTIFLCSDGDGFGRWSVTDHSSGQEPNAVLRPFFQFLQFEFSAAL